MKRAFYHLLIIVLALINLSTSAQNVDSLIRVLNSNTTDSLKAIVLYKLAEHYNYSNPDTSIYYYNKCIEQTKNKSTLRYNAFNDLAYLYLGISNYLKAQDCFYECLKIAEAKNDSLLIASTHSNLGNLYIQIELNDKAIYHLKKASEFINENKNLNENGKLYGRLGNFYLYQQYLKDAELNYQKAIIFFNKANNLKGVIIATQNLGVVEKRRKNYSKAIEYYKQAMASYRTIGYLIGEGQCLANIGNIYTEQKNFTEAFRNLNEALSIFKKTKQINDEILCYSEIAEIFRIEENYSKALDWINKAKPLIDSIPENKQLRIQVLYQLQFVNKRLGNLDQAYSFLLEGYQLNDSLNSSKLNDKIESLRIQYEVEQKDKNLRYLTLENELKDSKIRRKGLFQVFYLVTIGLSTLVIVSLYILFRSKKRANKELVDKNAEITQQKEEIEAQREEIEAQRDDLEVQRSLAINQRDEIIRQKKNITDSITYAKHIQTALLPNELEIREVIPDSFIFFKPLDIVSGDFYWVNKANGQSLIAVADCTGHGVPGAFMSVMGINFLNSLVIDQGKVNPADILNSLNEYVIKALSHADSNLQDKDGMDISVCNIDCDSLLMKYSSARIKVLVCRSGQLMHLESDKYSIGKSPFFETLSFSLRTFQLQKSDMLYLMTDGYTDQFGGKSRTKFLSSRFKKMAVEIANLDLPEQKGIIENRIIEWQGDYPQVDDMLIVGIRI